MPKIRCRALMSVGARNSLMAYMWLGSNCMPWESTWWPGNSMEDLKIHILLG